MDLSNGFDCVKHDFLIAKLHAYGFSHDAVSFLYSYLNDRRQQVKNNGTFSAAQKLNLGAPQGSVLELLFERFAAANGIVICSSADDTTIYTCDKIYKTFTKN